LPHSESLGGQKEYLIVSNDSVIRALVIVASEIMAAGAKKWEAPTGGRKQWRRKKDDGTYEYSNEKPDGLGDGKEDGPGAKRSPLPSEDSKSDSAAAELATMVQAQLGKVLGTKLSMEVATSLQEALQNSDKLKQVLASMDQGQMDELSNQASKTAPESIERNLRESPEVKKSIGVATSEIESNAKKDPSIDSPEKAFNSLKPETRDGARLAATNAMVDGVMESAEKVATKTTGQKPPIPWKSMARKFIKKSIPAAVFGIIDNGVMVLIGESIDASLGQSLGLRAMAAGGLGNTGSDMVGKLMETSIEKLMDKIGMNDEDGDGDEEKSERDKKLEDFAAGAGGVIGIGVGCLVGMLPMLFTGGFTKTASDRSRKASAIDTEWVSRQLRLAAMEVR